MPMPSHLIVENHGTLCLIRPSDDSAADWLSETAPEDAQWWSGALVVEPRYVSGVLEAFESD